jgi:hypothetical protein
MENRLKELKRKLDDNAANEKITRQMQEESFKRIKDIEVGGVTPDEKGNYNNEITRYRFFSSELRKSVDEWNRTVKEFNDLAKQRQDVQNQAWHRPGANAFGNFAGPGRIGPDLVLMG